MWVDNQIAHSGSRSIRLELNNTQGSRRNEFNLNELQDLVGDEMSLSVWMRLEPNLSFQSTNWFEFFVLYEEVNPPNYYPYFRLHLIGQSAPFDLRLGGRNLQGTNYDLDVKSNFDIPLGRWFNMHYYLKRDHTNGAAKVWIDGKLVFDESGINTKENSRYYNTIGKLYYGTGENKLHKMWIDDLAVYRGYVVPSGSTPAPTAVPTAPPGKTGDANGDGRVDGVDYIIWLTNYGRSNPTSISYGDFNRDNRVDGIDYVSWLNNYGN